MEPVVIDDVVLERRRRYVAAYLTLPSVAERVRVQGFGLPKGNLWEVRPCYLTQEQREVAVRRLQALMGERGIELPRLSREEAARLGRVMPGTDIRLG